MAENRKEIGPVRRPATRNSISPPRGGLTCAKFLEGDRRCGCRPIRGDALCINHSPSVAAAHHRENRSRLSREARRSVALEVEGNLAGGRALRRVTAQMIRALARGDLEPQRAYAIAGAINTMLRVNELEPLTVEEQEASRTPPPALGPHSFDFLKESPGWYSVKLTRAGEETERLAIMLEQMCGLDSERAERICEQADMQWQPELLKGLDFRQARKVLWWIEQYGGAGVILDHREDSFGEYVEDYDMSEEEIEERATADAAVLAAARALGNLRLWER